MSIHGENWKELVEQLADEAELSQISQILKKIPNLGIGKRKQYWERLFERKDLDVLIPLLEVLVNESSQEGYSSMIFPAMIGKKSAPNFWLYGEKEAPEQEEAWKAIYLLLSSVQLGNILLNLDNIADSGRKKWRELLRSEAATEFIRRIRAELGLKYRNAGPFFLSLLVITYWVYRVKKDTVSTGEELVLEEWMEEMKRNWGLRDDTVLTVLKMGRVKKEVHYFGRISQFITKWFRSYIEGKESRPSLVTFLDSLTATSSNKVNSDLIRETREKLVFHLLKYGEVNGEILERLVELRAQDTVNSKKRFMVMDAKNFFAKL